MPVDSYSGFIKSVTIMEATMAMINVMISNFLQRYRNFRNLVPSDKLAIGSVMI